jgi:hypothetical protein
MTEEPEQPVPPERRVEPARPLDYVRPTTPNPERRPFPVAAGMGVGFCVFLAAVAVWWPVGRGSAEGFALGLAGVPLIALVAAGLLQARLRWRGVVAGVLMAVGLAVLIPGIALAVICGGMRLK